MLNDPQHAYSREMNELNVVNRSSNMGRIVCAATFSIGAYLLGEYADSLHIYDHAPMEPMVTKVMADAALIGTAFFVGEVIGNGIGAAAGYAINHGMNHLSRALDIYKNMEKKRKRRNLKIVR